ncbi:MAG: type III pantothenate kinase [Candidatus Eisenbacteria bacterium]|nr:type III pantothenate kinase [Candidatus Eisenbacteria bacterium]
MRQRRNRRRVAAKHAPLLAIDIGNTHTVLGVFRGEELIDLWRISSGWGRTGDEVRMLVETLCHDYLAELAAEGRVCIGSVVPAITEEYEKMAGRLFDAQALVVTPATSAGVRLDVPDPSSIGADRIANAAAVAVGLLPAIVVDLGTATTFDVVRPGKRYVGGVIAPGIRTSAEDLFRRAAKLPKVEIRRPRRCIGRTTEESIRAGIYFGAVATIDGIVRRLQGELGRKPARVVATGGLAELVARESETIDAVDEALTLRGLLRIADLHAS